MQILKKCLHLGICRAAPLAAAAVLLAGCGRSGERVRMLLADTAASFSDDLALSLDAPEGQEPDEIVTGPEKIAVFVCGAVNEPGVYDLPEGARARDALEMAGGFRQDADTEYVNLARRVEDGEVLRFYTLEQTTPPDPAPLTEEGEDGPAAEVDINLAGYDSLVALPGIGDVKAKAIIQYRSENGPFTQIGQITRVKGISDSLFEKIRDLITV